MIPLNRVTVFTGACIYAAQDNSASMSSPLEAKAQRTDGVLWHPRIREDGNVAGHVALIGTRLVWKVSLQ